VPLAKVTMYGTNGPEGGALVVVVAPVVVAPVVVALDEVDGVVVVAPEEVVGAVVVASEDVEGVVVVAPDEVESVDVVVAVEPDDVLSPVVVAAVVVAPVVVASVAEPVLAAPVDVVGPVVVVSVEPEPVASVVVAPELESLEASVEVASLEVELENVLPIVIGETSPSAPETSSPSTKIAPMPTMTRICRRARSRVGRLKESPASLVPQRPAAKQPLFRPLVCRPLAVPPRHIVRGFSRRYHWPEVRFGPSLDLRRAAPGECRPGRR
jgi:hypothetical protein